jgi:hypothetical protein
MGLFSRKQLGDDVSRKQNKRSGEDETSINTGVEHAPAKDGESSSYVGGDIDATADKDVGGEDETSINSGVQHAPPADESAPTLERLEGEGEGDYAARQLEHRRALSAQAGDLPGRPELAAHDGNTQATSYSLTGEPLEPLSVATTPTQASETDEEGKPKLVTAEQLEAAQQARAAAIVEQSGYLPGTRSASAHDGNTQASEVILADGAIGGGAPPIANLSQQQEFAQETRLARIRQYVVEQGLAAPGEVGDLDDAELDALYQKSIGLKGTVSTPELSISPAQHAQAVLMSTSRADKIALVAGKGNLTAEQLERLVDEDLNAHVRNVVLSELQREEQLRAEEAAKLKPIAEAPYGGDLPKYYAVRTGASFAHEGQIVKINPGDVINDRSHNIQDLRARGVQLIETVAPSAPAGY